MIATRWLSVRSRRTRQTGGMAILIALALAVAACADRGSDQDGTAPDGEPVQGGTVVIASASDLGPLNPLVSADKYGQEVLRYLLFVPLLRYDSAIDYVPALAESFEMLGDTGVVLHLRRDVHWQDGPPTTSADVVFTYERAKDPATGFPSSGYLSSWTGVEAVDSYTVRFSFTPHADPLAALPYLPIVPKHLLDSIPSARIGQAAFSYAPVGNGPFRLVEYRANDRWVFAANDDFPEGLGGRPNVDRVVYRLIPEPAAQLTELRTGTIDMALAPPSAEFFRLDSLPNIRSIRRPSKMTALLGWNNRRAPLDDPRVRKALTMAIDRNELLALRNGFGVLAAGPIPPFHWAYPDNVEPLPFAPDSARALFAEAGIIDRNGDGTLELANGDEFAIVIKVPAQNDFNRNIAELVRGQLARSGVDVQIEMVEYNTLAQNIMTVRDFDAVVLGWNDDFRLNLRDTFHSANREDGIYQFAGYANATVDSLIEAIETAPNREAARPMFEQVQRIMRDEQPWTFLYYYDDLLAVNERVRGMQMDIRGVFLTIGDWWLSDAGGQARSDSAARSPSPDSAPAR